MNKTLCKFAWSGLTSTMINTFRPCCRFPLDENEQYPTTDDLINGGSKALNNPFFVKLRKDMLEGRPRIECQKCYVEEQSNIKSMRQKGNETFTSKANSYEFEELEFLEISLDNLCNLECRMCTSRFSTKLFKRDKLLYDSGLTEYFPSATQYKTIELMDSLNLDNLKMIKMLGGEPLISPNLLLFLNKIPYPENVDLLIVTNSTSIPNINVIEKFKTFKSVRFDFSIDGVFQYNDYQRVGSNFTKTIENCLSLAKTFNQQHSIHSVYSSVNIFGLETSTNWFKENLPFNVSIDIVRNNVLSPFIAPDWYVEKILENISNNNPNKEYVTNMFKEFHNYDKQKWEKFLQFCKITDDLYHTNISDINPILGKELKKAFGEKIF